MSGYSDSSDVAVPLTVMLPQPPVVLSLRFERRISLRPADLGALLLGIDRALSALADLGFSTDGGRIADMALDATGISIGFHMEGSVGPTREALLLAFEAVRQTGSDWSDDYGRIVAASIRIAKIGGHVNPESDLARLLADRLHDLIGLPTPLIDVRLH